MVGNWNDYFAMVHIIRFSLHCCTDTTQSIILTRGSVHGDVVSHGLRSCGGCEDDPRRGDLGEFQSSFISQIMCLCFIFQLRYNIIFIIDLILACSAYFITRFVKKKTNQKPDTCFLWLHIVILLSGQITTYLCIYL